MRDDLLVKVVRRQLLPGPRCELEETYGHIATDKVSKMNRLGVNGSLTRLIFHSADTGCSCTERPSTLRRRTRGA